MKTVIEVSNRGQHTPDLDGAPSGRATTVGTGNLNQGRNMTNLKEHLNGLLEIEGKRTPGEYRTHGNTVMIPKPAYTDDQEFFAVCGAIGKEGGTPFTTEHGFTRGLLVKDAKFLVSAANNFRPLILALLKCMEQRDFYIRETTTGNIKFEDSEEMLKKHEQDRDDCLAVSDALLAELLFQQNVGEKK